ncbi:hypothetical protein TNCV_4424721 [Trichonephila clavipes]|nr:hypothetical protein TNCV_4424721 [Trichonephila clavipes]
MYRALFKDPSMGTRSERDVYPIASHPIMPGDGQYDNNECTLPMCVHHNATEHGGDHLDAHGLRAESPCCSKRRRHVVRHFLPGKRPQFLTQGS